MSNLPTLEEIKNPRGKRVFLRGALNVPVENGVITDDYRLRCLLPTIEWLLNRGARVILAGHMSGNEANSFAPVAKYLKDHFELTFITDYSDGSAASEIEAMGEGEVILLENLRQYPGEKENDENFVEMLASYADVYVNDAFPTSHREHASIVGVPKLLPSFAGLQFIKEFEALSEVLNPEHPFAFILGGAKFSTKLPLVEKFSKIADSVFVGGALANAYLEAGGNPVGASQVPEVRVDLADGLASEALQLPADVLALAPSGGVTVRAVDAVAPDETIVDIGPETLAKMISTIAKAKLVVWNGPLGWYEKGFSEATDKLAEALAEIEGETILGGGDTNAVILDNLSPDDFDFVSTAGGAMIQFLANESLPGLEALRQ